MLPNQGLYWFVLPFQLTQFDAIHVPMVCGSVGNGLSIDSEVVSSEDQFMTEVLSWWCLNCSGVEGIITGLNKYIFKRNADVE